MSKKGLSDARQESQDLHQDSQRKSPIDCMKNPRPFLAFPWNVEGRWSKFLSVAKGAGRNPFGGGRQSGGAEGSQVIAQCGPWGRHTAPRFPPCHSWRFDGYRVDARSAAWVATLTGIEWDFVKPPLLLQEQF